MCPHEEKLTAWLLGDLSQEEQQEMTRHLEGCASCRAVREELSRVLRPLCSGLAKDRGWCGEGTAAGARDNRHSPAPSPAGEGSCAQKPHGGRPGAKGKPAPGRLASWLWHSPHEGLKRAALLTVSTGTLFALISLLYQSSQRQTIPASVVTHIEFKKDAGGGPPPTLRPVAESEPSDAAAARLDKDTAQHQNESFAAERAAVPYPEPPPADPSRPKLRQLPTRSTEMKEAVAAAAEAPAEPPAAAAAPAAAKQSVAKRERAKTAPATRPPADLQMKAARLAGAPLAHTNAFSTNAAPTNAVAPTAKGKP